MDLNPPLPLSSPKHEIQCYRDYPLGWKLIWIFSHSEFFLYLSINTSFYTPATGFTGVEHILSRPQWLSGRLSIRLGAPLTEVSDVCLHPSSRLKSYCAKGMISLGKATDHGVVAKAPSTSDCLCIIRPYFIVHSVTPLCPITPYNSEIYQPILTIFGI